VIVGFIRRRYMLTHVSIICGDMLASVNSVEKNFFLALLAFVVLDLISWLERTSPK